MSLHVTVIAKLTFKEKDGEQNAHTKASYCKEEIKKCQWFDKIQIQSENWMAEK